MRVLFLNLPSPPNFNIHRDFAGSFGTATPSKRNRYGHDSYVIPPLFFAYAAAVLRERGFKTSILDGQVRDIDLPGLIREARKQRPDLIVTSISLPSFKEDLSIIDVLYEALPSTAFLAWGAVCKMMPDQLLKEGKFGILIRGELEFTLPEVVEKLEKHDNLKGVRGVSFKFGLKICHNPDRPIIKNLDILPLPAYDLLDLEGYVFKESFFFPEIGEAKPIRFFPVMSSRGCSFACIYCPYIVFDGFGRLWRSMSAERTVNEIEHLLRNYGIKAIWFRDQLWSYDVRRASRICDQILARGLDVRWICETRADLLPRDLLKKMKKAGCVLVQIGLETGDPQLLRRWGKPMCRIEKIEATFRVAREERILRTAFIMIGLPGESWHTIENTRRMIKKIDPDELEVFITTPYPGTTLMRLAEQRNWILTKEWKKYTNIDPVMSMDRFTAKDMVKARRYLLDDFVVRKRLRNITKSVMQMNISRIIRESKSIFSPKYIKRVYKVVKYKFYRPPAGARV